MRRITKKHLEAKIEWLNKLTNSPKEYITDGKINVGHFCLSGAYGGYCLHRVVNTNGGVETPIGGGHIPARKLAEKIDAFILGIEFGKSE